MMDRFFRWILLRGFLRMADKRMFSREVVESDIFLAMPPTAQMLYFHLNLHGDDDGFVDAPMRIMRSVGCCQSDFDMLISKRYLLNFQSGVVVIKHWRLHNNIRKDRYKETLYKEEKQSLFVKDNGVYTDHAGDKHAPISTSDIDLQTRLPLDNHVVTNPQPDDNQPVPKCHRRLGEVRLGEKREEKEKNTKKEKSDDPVLPTVSKPKKHRHGEYNHVLLSDDEFSRLTAEWGEGELSRMIQALDEGIQQHGYTYKDHNLTLRKWRKKDATSGEHAGPDLSPSDLNESVKEVFA